MRQRPYIFVGYVAQIFFIAAFARVLDIAMRT
jgi:hypothetical protein